MCGCMSAFECTSSSQNLKLIYMLFLFIVVKADALVGHKQEVQLIRRASLFWPGKPAQVICFSDNLNPQEQKCIRFTFRGFFLEGILLARLSNLKLSCTLNTPHFKFQNEAVESVFTVHWLRLFVQVSVISTSEVEVGAAVMRCSLCVFRLKSFWRSRPGRITSPNTARECVCTARRRPKTWCCRASRRTWEESCGSCFLVSQTSNGQQRRKQSWMQAIKDN